MRCAAGPVRKIRMDCADRGGSAGTGCESDPRMRPLTVAEMMTTHVKTIYEDESISAADWDMVFGELRHRPVIDREHRVVGLVSDRDILRSAVQPA